MQLNFLFFHDFSSEYQEAARPTAWPLTYQQTPTNPRMTLHNFTSKTDPHLSRGSATSSEKRNPARTHSRVDW